MSAKNVVLVAGAHGVSGEAAAQHLSSIPGASVYGLSRSAPFPPRVISIPSISSILPMCGRSSEQSRTSHTSSSGAYIVAENSEVNVAILRNLLDVVEETSTRSSMSRFVKRIEGVRRHGTVAHL
jgi:hypothetical protein